MGKIYIQQPSGFNRFFTEKDYGTCVVKFIVNTDGKISNVEATTMKDTHLANIAMNAIRTGPKWIPATQNGITVTSYRLQPVTLTNPEKNTNNFAKTLVRRCQDTPVARHLKWFYTAKKSIFLFYF